MINNQNTLRKTSEKSEFIIIRSSSERTIPEVKKDSIKVLSFLNPLAAQTQKRYREIIRAFFAYYENFKVGDIESPFIISLYVVEKVLGHSDVSNTGKFLHASFMEFSEITID